MAWGFWFIAGFIWLAGWTMVAAMRTAAKDDDAAIGTFGALLPAFCALTSLVVFFVAHERTLFMHNITLWVHHASIFLLFFFLLSAEYFQLEAWWRIRQKRATRSVAQCVRNLWILSETMPAPIALTIFLTGLRLIWDLPEPNSPTDSWLLILIAGFSFFFWDGILGYQPIVRRMWETWSRAVEAGITDSSKVQTPHRTVDSFQLFLHFLSWPFVFLVGLYRWSPELHLAQPVSHALSRLAFLPSGWPEVTLAVILWLGVGAAVFAVRAIFKLIPGPKPKAERFEAVSRTE